MQAAATGIAPKVQPFFMESQSRRMRKRGCRINPSFLHRNCIIHRAILLSLCKTDKASKYGYFDKNLPDAASEHADRICARHSRQDFVGEPPCGYPRSAGRRQIDPRIAQPCMLPFAMPVFIISHCHAFCSQQKWDQSFTGRIYGCQ